MLNALHALVATVPWTTPSVSYYALAPELILAAGICVVLLADLFLVNRHKWVLSTIAGFSLLGAVLPIVIVGLNDQNVWSMFDGRYVVDDFSLVMKGLFLLSGYVVVLLSSAHVEEGDYWRGEFWFLLLPVFPAW